MVLHGGTGAVSSVSSLTAHSHSVGLVVFARLTGGDLQAVAEVLLELQGFWGVTSLPHLPKTLWRWSHLHPTRPCEWDIIIPFHKQGRGNLHTRHCLPKAMAGGRAKAPSPGVGGDSAPCPGPWPRLHDTDQKTCVL